MEQSVPYRTLLKDKSLEYRLHFMTVSMEENIDLGTDEFVPKSVLRWWDYV